RHGGGRHIGVDFLVVGLRRASSTGFPYATLFRSHVNADGVGGVFDVGGRGEGGGEGDVVEGGQRTKAAVRRGHISQGETAHGLRSEERRVGKEARAQGAASQRQGAGRHMGVACVVGAVRGAR